MVCVQRRVEDPRGLDMRMDWILSAQWVTNLLKKTNLLIEPPKSDPTPIGLPRNPIKAPSPPLDPPQEKDRLNGLLVVPIILSPPINQRQDSLNTQAPNSAIQPSLNTHLLIVSPHIHPTLKLVLTKTTAPASLKMLTNKQSSLSLVPRFATNPHVVSVPSTLH